jgi:moderate conductance mechanosensitive channel
MRLLLRTAVILPALLLVGLHAAGAAGTGGMPSFGPKPAKAKAETATPAEVQALLSLLADPKVQTWLQEQNKTEAATPTPAKPVADSPAEMMSTRLDTVREHITQMADAVPDMPAQFAHAGAMLDSTIGSHRPVKILTLVAAFVGLGFGAQALFEYATRRMRRHLEAHPVDTVGDRVRLVVERAAFAFGSVVAFAAGSIGAFLVLHWPGLLRHVVLAYLTVFLAIRIAAVLGRFLLAPRNDRFRVIPMDASAARFWYVRLKIIVGWIVLALVSRDLQESLGISPGVVNDIGAGFGLVWLAIMMEAIWRRPVPASNEIAPEGTGETRRLSRIKLNALLTLGLVALFGLRLAGTMPAFWLVAVAIAWPLADHLTRRAVEHLLRPPGTTEIATVPSLATVFLERGLRAVLIVGALALLAWGWGIDLESLTANETMMTRFGRGALTAVAIALVADFIWNVAKAAIDIKLVETVEPGAPNTDEARRRARLHTLLPIFRNILFVVVVVVAVMMALSAMGVEIGPLIAGASVIGVAIGFGAQTIVRDVISGMFYLLDDAFRIGEYIQAGHYKGTVEGFSLRSVRLRHQRGPVFTVPFSLLGAVENMSRDWVIDKITLGVTYDSDLDLARKLIKQIGLELQADPELGPMIIQPLKLQGVGEFGDFAIQLLAKMMTLPGQQFMVRRAAYAKIKKAFDANGIKFAFPTVQLAGDAEPAAARAAIAREALELTRPQIAAAE